MSVASCSPRRATSPWRTRRRSLGLRPGGADAPLFCCLGGEQLPHLHAGGAHLLEDALARRLVRTPAQELGAVAEASPGEVVVLHLTDELRLEPEPFLLDTLVPAARPARRF